MSRGKLFLISGLIIFAVVATGFVSVMKTGEVTVGESRGGSMEQAEVVIKNEVYEEKKMPYMIKEYYGSIGVFICSEDEYVLISIVDADISVLPEADVRSLEKGIYFESKQEMQMLIEDYIS